MDIRILEKTKKIGYIFDIFYDGKAFDSFDEMQDKFTVKGEFKNIMNSLGFSWAKGIQQGGRTDARVTGSNCLYISSSFNGNLQKLIEEFNEKLSGKMKITRVRKTVPNLIFPDYVEKREYIYRYPLKRIKRTEEEIQQLCKKFTGTYDVSVFTDNKGIKLKEHIRTVEVSYNNGELLFLGDSFMPKQVRIMSSFILTGEKNPLPGKYLTLSKIILKQELLDYIFTEVKDIEIENVEKIEKNSSDSLYIMYTHKNKKGEFIGKNGSNIKTLRKTLGKDIVVREL